jgi:hypothetical protein
VNGARFAGWGYSSRLTHLREVGSYRLLVHFGKMGSYRLLIRFRSLGYYEPLARCTGLGCSQPLTTLFLHDLRVLETLHPHMSLPDQAVPSSPKDTFRRERGRGTLRDMSS